MSIHELVPRARRYPVQLAVEFRVLDSTASKPDGSVIWLKATSHNISAVGILFSPDDVVPDDMAVDVPLEMRLLMPRELNPEVAAQARCRGRVVRVEPGSLDSRTRVAATIEHYKFERPPRN